MKCTTGGPYHSKYNPVERCWGILQKHWNGAKRTDVDALLGWAKSMTWKGVHPVVELSRKVYQKGISLSKEAQQGSRQSEGPWCAFSEAATVLLDEYALSREDPDAIGEQRFVALGMSATGALLGVVYTHRQPDVYRIISSWKASKPQRKVYEENRC